MKNTWFAVDKDGLALLLERRGRPFAVLELIQNAWDQNITQVDVNLDVSGLGLARLIVTDDDPDGFADLTHAYTIFAPSAKKADASKRGRFNLGEKLVLAICNEASISTTKGHVEFARDGKRVQSKARRTFGSEFSGLIRMTKAQIADARKAVMSLIPPPGIITTFNGARVSERKPYHTFTAALDTEIAGADGALRPTTRQTQVALYEPAEGEKATIYELGIPVVATSDRYHIDVGQKVPLNMDRDNVRPAYLRTLRTLVANEIHDKMDADDWTSAWGREALSDPRIDKESVQDAIKARFGDKVVATDPSDPEANNLAVSQGYTLVHGRTLSRDEWANVKRFEVIKPAGQVTPSHSKLELSVEGKNSTIPPERWTDGQRRIADYAKAFAYTLLNCKIEVEIFSDITSEALAAYRPGLLLLNVGRLGKNWFNHGATAEVDELLFHEFAHHLASNHLDHHFHEAICTLAAKAVRHAIELASARVEADGPQPVGRARKRALDRFFIESTEVGSSDRYFVVDGLTEATRSDPLPRLEAEAVRDRLNLTEPLPEGWVNLE